MIRYDHTLVNPQVISYSMYKREILFIRLFIVGGA